MEALHFGGGRDSLACLYLLRPRWPEITVVWMNPGAPFPETVAQMEAIKAVVPNFLEVRADVLTNIKNHGWPTDVLPVRNAYWGKQSTGETGIMMQTWFDCCSNSFWFPMQRKMHELGVTKIYRGQRLSEDYKSPMRSGQIVDGITYEFPLENWSEQQVSDYLTEQGVKIPAHYAHTQKSLDCWCCTAYLDAKLDQLQYLKNRHPDKYEIVAAALTEMRAAVRAAGVPLMTTEDLI
jgi:phosphoadenosine phosphosulfate reductase